MVGKIAECVTNQFLKYGLITDNQREWCVYTIHKKTLSMAVCCLLVLTGSGIGGLTHSLVFTFGFLFLRQRTNGYHAKTELGCIAVSLLFEIIAMWMLPYFVFDVYIVVLIGSFLCVLMLSPVNNKQIHLSEKEQHSIRWRAHLRTALVATLSLVLWYYGYNLSAISAALALFFTGISLTLSIAGLGIQ